jgi:hypothetical protein
MLWNSVSFTGFFGIFIPAPVASGARRDAASPARPELGRIAAPPTWDPGAFRLGNMRRMLKFSFVRELKIEKACQAL